MFCFSNMNIQALNKIDVHTQYIYIHALSLSLNVKSLNIHTRDNEDVTRSSSLAISFFFIESTVDTFTLIHLDPHVHHMFYHQSNVDIPDFSSFRGISQNCFKTSKNSRVLKYLKRYSAPRTSESFDYLQTVNLNVCHRYYPTLITLNKIY